MAVRIAFTRTRGRGSSVQRVCAASRGRAPPLRAATWACCTAALDLAPAPAQLHRLHHRGNAQDDGSRCHQDGCRSLMEYVGGRAASAMLFCGCIMLVTCSILTTFALCAAPMLVLLKVSWRPPCPGCCVADHLPGN
nr:p53 apoptosis effector related to PMP-22-like [Chlorocebus sabaeus]